MPFFAERAYLSLAMLGQISEIANDHLTREKRVLDEESDVVLAAGLSLISPLALPFEVCAGGFLGLKWGQRITTPPTHSLGTWHSASECLVKAVTTSPHPVNKELAGTTSTLPGLAETCPLRFGACPCLTPAVQDRQ